MPPDVKDIKALATALKLHSHFETLDRLARDWIERGMREKKAVDFEESERREWYDLRNSWEGATERLKKAINKFRVDTGFSPILRYCREVDSMGAVGKVFLGYDSPQAKGYRIIQIAYPAWFEELGLPTEEKSEEEVYRLVPVQRMSDEEERTIRESFVEDLREAGIERFGEYMPRYESTIDKRRTYNENVFRVDALMQTIIREHALAVPKPTPIAVARGRPGERFWARERTREDAEGDVRTFESAGLTCRILPVNGNFEVWCSGEVKTVSRPMLPPSEVKPAGAVERYPVERWDILKYGGEKYQFDYQIRGSWGFKRFESVTAYDELHAFMLKGEAELWVQHIRGKGLATWTPIDVPRPNFIEAFRWRDIAPMRFSYTLEQAMFTSYGFESDKEPQWVWRVSLYDETTTQSKYIEVSEKRLSEGIYGFPVSYARAKAAEAAVFVREKAKLKVELEKTAEEALRELEGL